MNDSVAKRFSFKDTGPLPPISAVGGKGYSLMRMAREGLPVPPGFVLTVGFFEPWFAHVTGSEAWRAFVKAPPDAIAEHTNALRSTAKDVAFNQEQTALVAQSLEQLDAFELFAVRSSSPDEDLAGASFAGGYETILGANRETMEDAVRQAFASCLDPRIFVYKQQRGFDVHDTRIAVVIQAQIASDVAGVGFSVEPISNDYDRAVFNANWGLGETVVSGLATPDQFVVDKISGEVLETTVGAKETSIWLRPEGGTEERADGRHGEATLDIGQLADMTRALNRVEALYGCPMDIEWAWQGGTFYLLQARPITTYLPLPDEIVTPSGQRRRLYLDATLAIQGIQRPLSIMGGDFLETLFRAFATRTTGEQKLIDPAEGIAFVAGNRMYVSLSHLFHLVEPKTMAGFLGNMDSLVGEILDQVDSSQYVSDPCPSYLHHLLLALAAHISSVPLKGIEAALLPEHSAAVYHRKVEEAFARMETDASAPQDVKSYADWLASQFVDLMVGTLIPPLAAAMMARSRLGALFADAAGNNPQIADDLVHIDQALPHNITIDMGLSLYAIASKLAPLQPASADAVGRHLSAPDVSPDIGREWHRFMKRFGFRGPRELDMAAPRYQDRPELLYKQLFAMTSLPADGDNPQAIHARSVERRHQAHTRLQRAAYDLGTLKGKEFDLLYRAMDHFGGFRENHKYYLVKAIALLRRRVLEAAEQLTGSGRLQEPEQVFDLTLEDLKRAAHDVGLDLQALIAQNTAFLKKLANVSEFPHVVDSRGRILRPKRPDPSPGELAGQAVSPGTAQGPVKVLHSPDEKPVLPGDILVTRATDPGWTPLFASASAIVLEVGGMLQHGSLVAREYGKPCVAGVQDATSKLTDGEIVEVDGSAGIVRQIR